jgi:hypothetical protein
VAFSLLLERAVPTFADLGVAQCANVVLAALKDPVDWETARSCWGWVSSVKKAVRESA